MLVPRPISSSTIRLRGVALFRMFAVSVISTMNVDCPRARSSLAPMRVKMRSTKSIRAAGRRHETAGVREQREQRHLPDVGGFARHVRPGDERDLRTRFPSESLTLPPFAVHGSPSSVIWHKAFLVKFCSSTGCRPSRICKTPSSATCGRQ